MRRCSSCSRQHRNYFLLLSLCALGAALTAGCAAAAPHLEAWSNLHNCASSSNASLHTLELGGDSILQRECTDRGRRLSQSQNETAATAREMVYQVRCHTCD